MSDDSEGEGQLGSVRAWLNLLIENIETLCGFLGDSIATQGIGIL